MPDATEWLVEYEDQIDGHQHEHLVDREKAIEYVRQLTGQGKTVALYQRIDFTVTVDVTVKAPRKRRKTPPPADKPDPAPPLTGPGNGAAGEPKEIGAASPQAAEKETGSGQPTPPSTASNLASPVFPWTCEARFDGDPACPGPVERDRVTCGWFCALHALIPESNRRELHRRNHARNRPVRVAHAG